MQKNGQVSSEYVYETTFMDAWILLERHNRKICTCSYCRKRCLESSKIKLWLPECKARNSWRVLCWNRNGYYYYLRSTLPTWRWFIHLDKWSGGKSWRLSSMCIGKNSGRSLISICKGSGLPTKFGCLESIFWIKM